MEYVPAIIFGLIVLLCITRPFTVLFHELGHALPAILITGHGATIYVGSYGNQRHSLKLTLGNLEIWFRYNPRKWQGGLCISKSTEFSLNQLFIFIISGPIFSFVVTAILAYLTFSFDLHGSLKLINAIALGSAILDLFGSFIPRTIVLADGSTMHSDGYYLYKIQKLKKFQKEYEFAVELYNKKEFEKVTAVYKDLLARGIEIDAIYQLAYTSYIFIKDYETAYQLLKDYESKYELNSNDYYNFAFVCFSLKLNDEKENHLKKSLDLNADNPYSYNLIGYELNLQNDFENALSHFDKAISLKPEFAYAYNNRGHAKIELGKLEEGLADINYSLQLDKENSSTYRNLGIYYLKVNQLQEAERLFLKAKEMDNTTELIEELLLKVTAAV